MHPEIERLIKLAIADGQITEKERAIILRKAEKLGEDIDEVELILDGELYLRNKTSNSSEPNTIQSIKEGVLKKCPSCGASVKSFETKCTECDHEFREKEASKSIKDIFDLLSNADIEERNRPRPKLGIFQGGELLRNHYMENAIANRQATIISSYPIANSKEDILEFLSLASSHVQQKLTWQEKRNPQLPRTIIWNAWNSKCRQVISKARFSMKEDIKTLHEIEKYANQLGIE